MKYYTDEKSQQIIIALLKAHGIRKVIASPGTTNVTLVGSMQNDPWFEMYSSVDERSAAYIATGLSAQTGEPVVLTCTGATASRNYLSGLTEAYYRKLPVLAITANQGRDKIGHLFAQNIDRTSVQNDVSRLSVSLPICKDEKDEWNVTVQVNKAILELTRNGGGPVHIDVATGYSTDFSVKELPHVNVIRRITREDSFPDIPRNKSIAVFVGSHKTWTAEETEVLDRFCASNDAVVLCDHTSGYKGKYRVQFSLIGGQKSSRSSLRNIGLLIHIGEVSGDYYTMKIKPEQVWRISPDGEIRDTFARLTMVFEMSETEFFRHYSIAEDGNCRLLDAYRSEYREIYSLLPEFPFSNIWMAQQMSGKLPEESVLHLGILNSLRAWNFFEVPSSVMTYSNVGGFGIDGCISSFIGAAMADRDRLFFGVFGDLTFFYDMNVLGNRHVPSNIRLMLVNNGKGTEFRNYGHICYDWGNEADRFMAAAGHYGNKSPYLVKNYVESLGYEYMSASSKEDFIAVLDRFLNTDMSGRPVIFEVFTDSDQESDALEMILNAKVDKKVVLKAHIKNVVAGVVGKDNADRIEKLIK